MEPFGRVLFVPSVPDSEWAAALIADRAPLELPVAGRRFVDYAVEHARRCGASDVEILDWRYSESVASGFAGEDWTGGRTVYRKGEGPMPRGLDGLAASSGLFPHGVEEGLAVVWGLCLFGHVPGEINLVPATPAECEETPAGLYRFVGGRWMRACPHGTTMRRVKAWHMANFVVLGNPGAFTLPCYSAESRVYLGRNVVIEHGTEVKPPVLLNSNTWFARNVTLEGDVIVGSGSFVGEGARLRRTLVGDDTYVGAGLELKEKIVIGNRIVDAESGAYMDVEEPGVARSIPAGFGWMRTVWRFLRGRSCGRTG